MISPYDGIPSEKWLEKTRELIAGHPLESNDIVGAVLESWESIFESRIGKRGIRIGVDIFPIPQIMGSYLHELIPLELAARHSQEWRGDKDSSEKDLVYIPDPIYSIEVKTSSHETSIFANRSYAQPQSSAPKKSKSGYYIAVNFEKFENTSVRPRIRRIRFGWLDHTDWIAQKSATGQQARLKPESNSTKLILLHEVR